MLSLDLHGTPLTPAAASDLVTAELDRKEADSILDRLIEDPEVRDLLQRKIRTLRE